MPAAARGWPAFLLEDLPSHPCVLSKMDCTKDVGSHVDGLGGRMPLGMSPGCFGVVRGFTIRIVYVSSGTPHPQE